MSQRINTVIVGGGQAGLAVSYYLKQELREHVLLERATAVANAWRNERWDSFTLVTPNFQVRMPGAEYDGNDPYGFMSKADVVKYFDDYVERFDLPVHCGVEVFSVEKLGRRYVIRTSEGDYEAANVVIATGLYQAARIPPFSAHVSSNILQLHSSQYRNPSSLPSGAVLIVGNGQSGAQIAQELYQSGRKVYLSIGSAGRVPRRYRGKDINDWFTWMGMFDTKVEELQSPKLSFMPIRKSPARTAARASIFINFPGRVLFYLGTCGMHMKDGSSSHRTSKRHSPRSTSSRLTLSKWWMSSSSGGV